MTDFYRALDVDDLEVRSDGDGRTVQGLAVPYAKPQRITDRLTEQFEPGAFAHQLSAANRVFFTRGHQAHGGAIIGALRSMREDAKGLVIEARVSKTATGDETLELLRDGVLSHLSIGFRERTNRRLPGGVLARTKADLFEVSVVPAGAYGDGATVTDVREVVEETAENLDKLRRLLATFPTLSPA